MSTDARRDRREAQAYYRGASPAAYRAFRRELEKRWPSSSNTRSAHRRVSATSAGSGSCTFRPYTVLYRVIGKTIFVLAIASHVRDPDFYAERLQ